MKPRAQAEPTSARERLWLVLLLLLSCALRLLDIRFHSDTPDQGYSIGITYLEWPELIRATAADTHPPLYYVLLKLWFLLVPRSTEWAQVLSVIFAGVTLYLVWRLGRDLFSRAVGWIALACAALAPYQVMWSHSARNHQLQPVAVALIILLSYHYLSRPHARTWCGLASAWLLAIQTNYMAFVVGLVWGAAFLIAERSTIKEKVYLALAPAPGLLSFALWLPILKQQVRTGPMNHDFFQETVSPIYLYYHSLFGVMSNYQPNQTGVGFLLGLMIFTIIVVFGAAAVGRRWSWWILLLGLPTLPILTAKLMDWTLAERHLLFALPIFMVYWGAAVSVVVARMQHAVARRRRTISTITALILGVLLSASARPGHADTVALWLFDESPGASLALDSSGNGHDLTLGPDAATVPGGKFGYALDCNATAADALGAYRDGPADSLNFGDSDWTLECWARAKSTMTADWDRIWGIQGDTLNFFDYGNNTAVVVNVFNGSRRVAEGNPPSPNLKADELFHHLALVYQSGNDALSYYFDGQRRWSYPFSWEAVAHPTRLQIGMRGESLSRNFEGYLDEMRFSNVALYTAESYTPPGTFATDPVVVPLLQCSSERVRFTSTSGEVGPGDQTLNLSTNKPPLDWNAEEFAPWLNLSALSGRLDPSQDVSLTADPAGLAPGMHRTTIVVTAPNASNSPREFVVEFEIVPRQGLWDIGNRKQLFIDRRFIDASSSVTLTLNPAENMGIALDTQTQPWSDLPYGFSTVIQDGGKIKLYYNSSLNGNNGLALVESEDGIHFTRPTLGLVTLNGRNTNIIQFDGSSPDSMIFVDPHDIPARRYKLLNAVYGEGVYASYSPDGLHFTGVGLVFPLYAETGAIAMFDPKRGKYVVYTKMLNVTHEAVRNQDWYSSIRLTDGSLVDVGHEHLRSVGRIETDSLLQPWPYTPAGANPVIPTKAHIQLVLTADEQDDPHSDIYVNAATPYPWAEDVYLMFPAMFRHFDVTRQPWFAGQPVDTNGPAEIQLAVSRDGVQWERSLRRPYIHFGLGDESDRWWNSMHPGIARVGNYLYHYYRSAGALHSLYIWRPEYEDAVPVRPTIQVARQRLDGFISADFAYGGGWLTTPVMSFSGRELRLNLDAGAMGSLFVEIRDASNKPIPGYTLADCEEVGGNFVDMLVRWKGQTDLSGLAGQPVRLHFAGRAMKLYAFQFTGEKEPQNTATAWGAYGQ